VWCKDSCIVVWCKDSCIVVWCKDSCIVVWCKDSCIVVWCKIRGLRRVISPARTSDVWFETSDVWFEIRCVIWDQMCDLRWDTSGVRSGEIARLTSQISKKVGKCLNQSALAMWSFKRRQKRHCRTRQLHPMHLRHPVDVSRIYLLSPLWGGYD